MKQLTLALAAAMVVAAGAHVVLAQQAHPQMSFFITSVGSGDGANLGGLAGADAHCQKLASAVGAGNKQWRAYLSTQGPNAVNAKDRIGAGPWFNSKGVQIAANVAELHGENKLTKDTQLTEKGTIVNGRGDTPNQHDILTGSNLDGTAPPPARIAPAATGPATARARPSSATTTARAAAPTRPPGTAPTPRRAAASRT